MSSADAILYGDLSLRSSSTATTESDVLEGPDGVTIYRNVETVKPTSLGPGMKIVFWTIKPCPLFGVANNSEVFHRVDGEPAVIVQRDDGSLRKDWYANGKNYRAVDKPASVETDPDGNISRECFTDKDGSVHREDGPAEIKYKANGEINGYRYWNHGELHREDGPAKLEKNEIAGPGVELYWAVNGNITRTHVALDSGYVTTRWFEDNAYIWNTSCRSNAPAEINIEPDGTTETIYARLVNSEYFFGVRSHREDGPAYLKEDGAGELIEEVWLCEGERHREDGPARTYKTKSGAVRKDYYLKDQKLTRAQFESHPRGLAAGGGEGNE